MSITEIEKIFLSLSPFVSCQGRDTNSRERGNASLPSRKDTWQEITLSIVPTSDKIWLQFGLFGPQSNVDIYFDDFSITLQPSAPPSFPANQTWKYYYYAGTERIAMRVRDASSDQLFYLLKDHLGGLNKTVDGSSGAITELRYRPFGETRFSQGSSLTTLRYTGQREDLILKSLLADNGASPWIEHSLIRLICPDGSLILYVRKL